MPFTIRRQRLKAGPARVAATAAALLLATIGLLSGPAPSALAGTMVVYNSTPTAGSVVIGPGCTTTSQYNQGSSGGWSSVSTGDYTGSGTYGQTSSRSCNGTTNYLLDAATQTGQYRWHLGTFCGSGCTSVPCKVWAYIPTTDAGDWNARYDFWADDGNGNLTWLAWPGGNVNQEQNSGWAYLGQVTVGNTHILTISLSNQDAAKPGWYAGAGDVAVNCPAQQVIPAVPSRLLATGTDTTTPTLSGVVQSASGGQVTGNIYLADSAGNPIGGSPTATGVVTSGDRVVYTVPTGVLTMGDSYQWSMTACQGSVCSAATSAQSFTLAPGSTSPPPGSVTTTITGPAITGTDADITPGACSGSDCPAGRNGLLKVGSDGTNPWRSGLKADLSSIPAGSQIVGATLNLTEAGCLNGCPAAATLAVYPADSDVTAQATGPALAAAADATELGSGPGGTASIDVTSAAVAWLSGADPNDGLVLEASDESTATPGVSYFSPSSGAAAADLPALAVTYVPPTVPDAPSGLALTAGDGGVAVSWTVPGNEGDTGGVTSYTVSVTDGSGTQVASATTANTSAVLTGLTDGTSYTVAVTAANDVGSSQPSSGLVAPVAATGGTAQYVQAVQQFLQAQESLAEGTYTTASDAAAALSAGPAFAAQLQAESSNDTGLAAGLAAQGLVQTSGTVSLSGTLVIPGSPGSASVLVDSTEDLTYDTVAGQGTPGVISTPGEIVTSYQFTFATGTTPALTGYVDADDLASSSATPAEANAVSASLAQPAGPGPANLAAPASTTVLDANGDLATSSEAVPASVYTSGILQYARSDWSTGGWPGFPHEDCADFSSRALDVGGHLPMREPWYDAISFSQGRTDLYAWWYAKPSTAGPLHSGPSYSWGDAADLAQFLVNKGNHFFTSLGNVVPGDLIFVNWSGARGFAGINHVGIVTLVTGSGSNRMIYITQHTTNAYNESLTRWMYTTTGGTYDGIFNSHLKLWAVAVTGD